MPTPYVVGQWVYGGKFYGRADLVNTILHGNRNCLWLLGTRRIGKTSILKQVEHLTSTEEDLGYFSLFWDFQGAEDPQDLHQLFNEALIDAADRLEELEIPLEEVEAEDLFISLSKLRRKIRSHGKKLLLLCDEVEELVRLSEKDPRLLRRLRRALQSQEDIRSVLASKIKLWELAGEETDTSPFLLGFTPPLYIHSLADDDARALIRQANLPSESQPRFGEDSVETIRDRCNNHPYLIQMLCECYLNTQDLQAAIEEIASDRMVSFFFAEDFKMLSEVERQIVRIIGEQESSTHNSIQEKLSTDSGTLGGHLSRLEHLGYIRRDEERNFVLANYFFKQWFSNLPTEARPAAPTPSVREALADLFGADAPREALSVTESTLGHREVIVDNRYKLQKSLGRGATGEVFQAFDQLLRTDVAVKLLKPEYARHEEAVERLRREVLLSRDLSHPNIVGMYHLGEHEGTKYLTMRWLDGPTLAKVIAWEAPFSTERTVFVAGKLASALQAAHARKVLHRDIKPSNIIMDEAGEPHITDFGLARLVGGEGMTSHGVFLGSPGYASPEQALQHELDERADLYSLGVVIFEMATGDRPFRGGSTREVLNMHMNRPAPDPRDLRPEIPEDLSRLILRCLEKDPDRRPQSAGEVEAALRDIV